MPRNFLFLQNLLAAGRANTTRSCSNNNNTRISNARRQCFSSPRKINSPEKIWNFPLANCPRRKNCAREKTSKIQPEKKILTREKIPNFYMKIQKIFRNFYPRKAKFYPRKNLKICPRKTSEFPFSKRDKKP